jgi:mono/diheme cytochrome c family protein
MVRGSASFRWSAWTPLLLAILAFPGPAAQAADERPPAFARDVLPIFKQHCVKCHRDKPKRSGLDLRDAAGLAAGSDDGPVLVKGSAAKSVLFEKIVSRTMPPPEKQDRLSDQEIATIRKWIDAGARGMESSNGVAQPKERVVTDQDRAFWAFQKPTAAPVPAVRAAHRLRTPIDAFLLARLEARGLTFSPDAHPPTLLRRAYLDLIGLPPSPDEVQAFLTDPRPDRYERVLDHLLESPLYGERWGRHWLDVAGYTDSPHFTADKAGRMVPFDDWRYRDYVVRSFNRDKPYDRFLTEQLAGDELVDWRSAVKYTPDVLDTLVATGYLRTTPDWTHSPEFPNYRFDTLSRVVDHVSTGLFGLTLGCARCHSHKFDPIPHEDYYRLMAVFATAYNPDRWLPPVDRFLADVPPAEQAAIDRHNARIAARQADITSQLEGLRARHRRKLLVSKLAKLPQAIRADVDKALAAKPPQRNEVQRYLASKFAAALAVSDQELTSSFSQSERALAAKWQTELASLAAAKRSFNRLQGLFDVGKPPKVRQLIRGDPAIPGKVVQAAFPSVLCPPGRTAAARPPDTKGLSSGRRLALARWLTSPDHSLTARVMVNRIWQHHFGRGIVATPENFGRSGSPPTHPELLDWLAVEFRQGGWSVKRLHKLIMMSTAYRQSAHRPPADPRGPSPALTADPDNDLLWRMNLRRVEAEVLRDSVLAVSGKLDRTMGGPPIAVQSNPDGLVTVSDRAGPAPTSHWRRTLYLRSLRGSHASGQGFKLSMLEIFDYPEMAINCTRRTNSATPLQSLALINSNFMLEQSRHFAERVHALAGAQASLEQLTRVAFVLALGRVPTAAEADYCRQHLHAQTELYRRLKLPPAQAAQRALAGLCSILLASNEFLYIG